MSAGEVPAAHTHLERHVIVNRGALTIGEETYLGIGATVSDHLSIGSRHSRCAGAIVVSHVSDGERVAGRRERRQRE